MIVRRVLAGLLAVAVASAGLMAAPAAAAPAAPAPAPAAVVVAPDGGGILQADRPVSVLVQVTNTGTAALAAGDLAFSMEAQPVASSTALVQRIAEPQQVLLGTLITGTKASVPAIPVGGSAEVRARISVKDLASIVTSASGARLLYVRYRSGGAQPVQVVGKSAVVRMSGRAADSIGLGTVVPVLAPAGTTGIVDVATQQALTDPRGAWDTAVRAAEAAPWATVALDPAVIASIRLAGAGAPPAATDLLDRLERLPNQVVELPYLDGDVTLERAAGTTRTLAPSSFAGTSAEPVAGSATEPTPLPTATAGAAATSVDDLTAWRWSEQEVAWPVPGTATTADLAALSRSTLLLPSSDVADSTARRTAGPLARVGPAQALIADSTASSLLAVAAGDGLAADAALAQLVGVLATEAVTDESSSVLAMPARSTDLTGLGRVLSLLGRQGWISGRSLQDLTTAQPPVTVTLRQHTIPAQRVGTARDLLAAEKDVREVGSAVTSGSSVVTGPARLALLAGLSAAWRGRDAEWRSVSEAIRSALRDVDDSVRIPPQSTSNAIGTDGRLSVVVANTLTVPVEVVVRASVSNGRLQFDGNSSTTMTVPAGGSNTGRLGFRTITNGSTEVTLRLETPTGAAIGAPVQRKVSVSAGFDTIVAVVLLTALGLLLALGVYRNVVRRRQPRTASA